MNVSLNQRLENFIHEQVEQGRYNNASEVVREGLRLLEERELRILELREEIKKGVESGSDGQWSKTSFLKKVHAKLQEGTEDG